MKKPIINPGIIKRLKSIFAIVQDGDVATRNIASGKYVLWKNVPCHASSAITTGDTLAIGTNLTADNDGFINALHDGLGAFSGKAIANNLTTETAGYVLDARQGKELSDSVSSLNDRMPTLLWTNSSPTTPRGEGTIATGIDFKGFTFFAVKVKAHVSVDRYVSCIVPLASETEMIFVTDTTTANRNVYYRYITINNGNVYITGATGGDGTTYQDRLIPAEVYGIW